MKTLLDIGTAIIWAFGLIMLGKVLFASDQTNIILLILGAVCFIFGSIVMFIRFRALPGNIEFKTDGAILKILHNYKCKQD